MQPDAILPDDAILIPDVFGPPPEEEIAESETEPIDEVLAEEAAKEEIETPPKAEEEPIEEEDALSGEDAITSAEELLKEQDFTEEE
jgi:hypothetical protein